MAAPILTEIEESLQRAGIGRKFWTVALKGLGAGGEAMGAYLAIKDKPPGNGFTLLADKIKETEGHVLFMAAFRAMVRHGIKSYVASLSRLDDMLNLNAQGAPLPDNLLDVDHLGITGFCDDVQDPEEILTKRRRMRIEDLIRRRLDNNKAVSVTARGANLCNWWSNWVESAMLFENNKPIKLT